MEGKGKRSTAQISSAQKDDDDAGRIIHPRRRRCLMNLPGISLIKRDATVTH